MYYNEGLRRLRQSGDIDLWIEGARNAIIRYVEDQGIEADSIDIKHWPVHIFNDTEVEIHFRPSWFYCPVHDHRFMKWVELQAKTQFENTLDNGIVAPTDEFNLVFLLIHVYRHLFNEGIGLRQFLDYYFILMNSSDEQRKNAFETVKWLGMKRFASAVMHVMELVLGLDKCFMICEPSAKRGAYLLEVVMTGGNFGKYDIRYGNVRNRPLLISGVKIMLKNMNIVCSYPSEVLWAPFWKVWHRCWLWKKGYLR